MKIDILTLFPEMFKGPFDESIIKRAQEKGLVKINVHNLRDWGLGKRKTVDDRPFGGGTGMIMMIEPIYNALADLTSKSLASNQKIVLLTPRGKVLNQNIAFRLAKIKQLIFICGHYEGVDERVRQLADEEISIGDYVLTGGELPAMIIVDAVARLIPGVLEKPDATKLESFSKLEISKIRKFENLLEYPQYTRPEKFKNWKVPEILLSGNHQKITEWRKKKSLALTKKYRPDLIN